MADLRIFDRYLVSIDLSTLDIKMTRLFSLALALIMIVTPAYAGGGKKKAKSKKPSNHVEANWEVDDDNDDLKEVDVKEVGQAVDISTMILPIQLKNRLSGYAFISLRIIMADDADVWHLRSKTHFLKDAIIKDVHIEGVHLKEDFKSIDKKQLVEVIKSSVSPWVKASQISSIEFTRMDIQL